MCYYSGMSRDDPSESDEHPADADSQPSPVWPPPLFHAEPTTPAVNTSGTRSSVPPEVLSFQWSWGASLLPIFWSFANRAPLFGMVFAVLLILVFQGLLFFLLIDLLLRLYLGFQGHRIAWRNRRFDGGVPEFVQVQTVWRKWGLGVLIAGAVSFAILTAMMLPGILSIYQAFKHE